MMATLVVFPVVVVAMAVAVVVVVVVVVVVFVVVAVRVKALNLRRCRLISLCQEWKRQSRQSDGDRGRGGKGRTKGRR